MVVAAAMALLRGVPQYLLHWWPSLTTEDESELGPTRWIPREALAISRLCVGYIMEFETYGHVEAHVAVPTAGELEAREAEVRRQKEQRRLEAEDHQRREAAATKLQAHIRGRQARTSYHRSLGVTMTRSGPIQFNSIQF